MAATRKQTGSRGAREIMFKVEGLTKVYHTGELDIHALGGVDPTLYEGELAVLLGPSGSGKSTLLNILGGGSIRQRRAMPGSAATRSPRWASANSRSSDGTMWVSCFSSIISFQA